MAQNIKQLFQLTDFMRFAPHRSACVIAHSGRKIDLGQSFIIYSIYEPDFTQTPDFVSYIFRRFAIFSLLNL